MDFWSGLRLRLGAGSSWRADVRAPSGAAQPADARPRDHKRLLLVIGLGALSWVATYVGTFELIQSKLGDLPFLQKVIIGFSVALLMTMIMWLLDKMGAHRRVHDDPLKTSVERRHIGLDGRDAPLDEVRSELEAPGVFLAHLAPRSVAGTAVTIAPWSTPGPASATSFCAASGASST
ncbi:MAG TPA: hypothetical protein VH519_14175 [Hyphomicrobiaceae bacterium]|jgi:hypothetical protein